jgi:hypothetical protein
MRIGISANTIFALHLKRRSLDMKFSVSSADAASSSSKDTKRMKRSKEIKFLRGRKLSLPYIESTTGQVLFLVGLCSPWVDVMEKMLPPNVSFYRISCWQQF